MRRRDREHGQILVIVAFGMLALIAIGAIAIDLGFSWMLRRQEQNAADPAAVAAARWLRDSTGKPRNPFPEANWDACFYARENGFFPNATTNDLSGTGCVPANDPDGATLDVQWPPQSGPFVGHTGKIQVVIRSTHPSFFAPFFGQDFASVSTGAVAANENGNSNSSSLVALQPECQAGSAGDVDGGGVIRIFPVVAGTVGGYVHVNSPCGNSTDDLCKNGVGQSALSISGTLKAPFTNVVGSCTVNGSNPAQGLKCEPATVLACLDEDSLPLGDPLAGVPEPRISDFPNGVCPGGTPSTPSSTSGCALPGPGTSCPTVSGIKVCRLRPGVYYGGWDVGNKVNLELEPGMYILAGGGIKLSGNDASIEAVSSPTGVEARITIFSTDGPGCPSIGAQCQGSIRFTARQAFQAKALNTATCGIVSPQACPWKGILLWQDGTASHPDAEVHLGGQASTILAGTIYAPKAQVEVTGGSGTTGCTSGPSASCLSIQIISWRWKVTGTGLVEMPYDPAELYQLNQRGLVH